MLPKTTISIIIVCLSLIAGTATAEAPATESSIMFKSEGVEVLDDRDYSTMVRYYADKYGVSYEKMYKTIECESNFNPNAVGDNGQSRGLSQIHRPSWDITDEQAFDPDFAIEFMAKQFSTGGHGHWTCYRMIYEGYTL